MPSLRRTTGFLLLGLVVALLAWAAAPPGHVGWGALEDGVTVQYPDGEGPFPVTVLMHGCGGPRPFLPGYADAANEAGAAAVIVDSFGPRGIGRLRAIFTVCTGFRLHGAERANDIAVLLENLDEPRLDLDRVNLAGWSHGAWAAAAALTHRPMRLAGIESAFLVYPYCRFPARWPGKHAPTGVEVLAVVPDLDHVGDSRACREALKGSGAEVVRIANATHAFDDPDPSGPGFAYNAEASAENMARYQAFLEETLRGD